MHLAENLYDVLSCLNIKLINELKGCLCNAIANDIFLFGLDCVRIGSFSFLSQLNVKVIDELLEFS
jgi:hypothetical protein